jgi:2-succinyl-6-hydroxy-2,4-cyclohexadiene-1-carboxylate synthase
MIGHGDSMSTNEEDYCFAKSVVFIKNILKKLGIKKINIFGYSLGARLALHCAIFGDIFDNKINTLILCSGSFGVENKEQRIISDKKIISMLENNPLDNFVSYWENIAIWKTQKNILPSVLKNQKKIRLEQNKKGLALSLKYQGQGEQENLFDKLKKISCNTLIMYGELDKKYKKISEIMKENIKNSKIIMCANSGHNIVLENPEFIEKEIKNFILG